MRSKGGTGGHVGSRKGANPLQLSLFEETEDDRP
jgi:hypothetical protein